MFVWIDSVVWLYQSHVSTYLWNFPRNSVLLESHWNNIPRYLHAAWWTSIDVWECPQILFSSPKKNCVCGLSLSLSSLSLLLFKQLYWGMTDIKSHLLKVYNLINFYICIHSRNHHEIKEMNTSISPEVSSSLWDLSCWLLSATPPHPHS